MLRTLIPSLCLVAWTLAVTGCQQEPVAGTPEPGTSSTEPAIANTAEDAGDSSARTIEQTIATFDELQTSIAESKGRIVVVDYWSTQCLPCMTEFPGLVAIHNEFPHDQVRCISASLDYEGLPDFSIEDARKASLEFLEQQQATLDNFILSEDSLTVMDDKLKIASIPAVFVFDVDGKLARLFDESSGEPFTYEKDITPFVKELVSQRFSTEPASADIE